MPSRGVEMERKQRRIFDAIDPALRPTVLEVLHDLREAMDQA
ncbi:hypothetical protein ACFXKD_12675 [Nocardiopsis aegyptia]